MIWRMTRRFLAVTIGLAATVSFLVGLIVAGTMTPAPATSAPEPRLAKARTVDTLGDQHGDDVVRRHRRAPESGGRQHRRDDARDGPARRRSDSSLPEVPDLFERRQPAPDRDVPRRGAGTGFIIDPAGYILTNHHVIADSTASRSG